MTETKEGNRALMLPLLAGLLGAGLALMFAPRSGRETRQKMRLKAEEMKQQAEDGMSEVKESLDRSIREAQDLRERLSAAMSSTGKKAKQEMKELKDEESESKSPVLSTWEEEV